MLEEFMCEHDGALPAAISCSCSFNGLGISQKGVTERARPGLNILLVEDDDLVRDCLFEALHEAGHLIEGIGSAEAALMCLNADRPPSVVVTDINLGPGMDGLAFAKAAREVCPGLPVVFISGRYAELRGMSAFERFLPKPFTTPALLRAIDDVRNAACGAQIVT